MGKTIRSGVDRSKLMAGQIRLLDSGSIITAKTLEGAMQEVAGDIDTIDGELNTIDTVLGDSGVNGGITLTDQTPVNAIAAAGKITSSGVLVPGSHAESIITSDATAPADGKIVTIGTTVYRFKTVLAQAYDVAIGASAAESLDNLKAAINASGTPGTEYFAGTLVHPDVIATDNAATTQKIVARVPGTTPNSIVTTEDSDHLSWEDTTLGGGAGSSVAGVTTAASHVVVNGRTYSFVTALSETSGADAIVDQVLYGGSEAVALDNFKLAINAGPTAGTEYSTGTVVNPDVTAGTNTNTTQVVTAKVKGVIGHAITITTDCANTAWDAAVLGTEVTGVDGTVGKKDMIVVDTGYIYICTADNTIADANWKSVAIS